MLAIRPISFQINSSALAHPLTLSLNSMTNTAGHSYLIDDDESMRTSLGRMLCEVGYIVEDCASAVTFYEKPILVAPALIFLNTLKAVADTSAFDGPQFKRVSENVGAKKDYAALTPREEEVCSWSVKSLFNKGIALQLGNDDVTIKIHKVRVMDEMLPGSMQTLHKKFLRSDLGGLVLG